ncbi:ABC transporter ATP-binding protein [Jiangella ureilytica]|uniref:ABC transporter ATP-binding protein n=1 Tax=Jiangella ureilytica TaxID=2530374 RepID=A0A4R4RVL6_9ACTN|nr:ABC transporter ATP-binding protein [Jiangella ureilytica]TDC53754.1 ABC transporter ATP-binding protein [Jiangella ureilytica]
MTGLIARAAGVSRRYGDIVALDHVDLDIPRGQLVGLLGPNGAGKSTLINLFVGLRRPDDGRVEIRGRNPMTPATRRIVGVTPQETGLPLSLRVGETARLVAAHFADPVPPAELFERFGLTGIEGRQCGSLSGGQKRRLAVALAFAGRPEIVFLDEPTTGLDVDARHHLWEGIRAFHAEGGTVVLTSHYLDEVEALAERVVVIDHGRVIRDGSTAEIRDVAGMRRVSLTAGELPALPGVVSAASDDTGRAHLMTTDADALVRELVTAGVPFRDLEVRSTSLEDAFLAMTANDHRSLA